MMTNVAREQAQLQKSSVKKLRVKYAELFGEETKSGNKVWLIKRILWRMQALQEGDLSERARQRAEAIANDADLRTIPPPTFSMGSPTAEQQTTTKCIATNRTPHL